MPDDVLPQPPAVGLQGEGDAPGDADEVLGLERPQVHLPRLVETPLVAFLPVSASAEGSFPDASAAFGGCGVAVPQIDPTDAVLGEHPAHLAEDGDQVAHERFGSRLRSETALHGRDGDGPADGGVVDRRPRGRGCAIVPQPEVGRTRDAALNRLVGESFQQGEAVALQEGGRLVVHGGGYYRDVGGWSIGKFVKMRWLGVGGIPACATLRMCYHTGGREVALVRPQASEGSLQRQVGDG